MATSTSDLTTVPTRRRYVRSNTSSVTQILSDSCNSILQRFRRNPSEKPDKQRSQYRFNDLAPSASSSAVFGRDRHGSTTSTSDYGSLGSSSDSVHRTSSYASFNSTMSSYYKPLFRTFGKRFDSPPKRETEDKDKTPIVAGSQASSSTAESSNGKSSAVSRLESKYSDILDRVHRRKEIKDDKEKTLEPERTPTNFGSSRGFNALAKSATTSHVRDEPFSLAHKERTPYRLATQRNRNKFLESLEMDYYKKRAELAHKTNSGSSVYERSHRELSSSSKYVLKPRSKDSGYYDSKSTLSLAASSSGAAAAGKENIFKSKYDPDEMLSEFNGSSILAASSSSSAVKPRRHTRPYKRSDTTALSFLQNTAPTAEATDRKREHRRSGNFHQLQRSTTQGFFDADDICTSPGGGNAAPTTNDDDTPSNDPKQIERNHRRKEIETILAKYAPKEDKPKPEPSPDGLTRIKSPTTGSRFHHRESRLAQYGPSSAAAGGTLQKSLTMSNVSSHLNGGGGLYNGNGSILTIHTGASSAMYKQQQALQHQLLMRSSRSRIPKALSTFVSGSGLNPERAFVCVACLTNALIENRRDCDKVR